MNQPMGTGLIMAAALAVAVTAGPANRSAAQVAGEVDIIAATMCFDQARLARTDPATCLEAAHAACLAVPQDTPAVATLCFRQAQQDWSAAIGALMQDLTATASDTITAIAQIETKYDLLSALLQCDRREELSRAASDIPGAVIALQKADCMANAAALTYLRLYFRVATRP